MPDAARTELDSPSNPTATGRPAGPPAGSSAGSFLTPDLWRGLRWAAIGGYLVILLTWIIVVGIPLDRIGLTLWILFGLADTLGMPLHAMDAVHADMWLFSGTLPTIWLQSHFYDPSTVHWWDVLATVVYVSHFVVFPIVAAVLWLRDRVRFRAWIYRVLALAVMGVTTYILYPLAPPWLTSEWGLIPDVSRISGRGWSTLGLSSAGQVLSDGQALANPVAAMPSLHSGYAALVALFFCLTAPWWARPLLLLYPLAMGLTLIYSGEHYVIDVLFGYLYAAVIMLSAPLLRRLRERWRRRRAARGGGPGPVGEPGDKAVPAVPAQEPQREPARAADSGSLPADPPAGELAVTAGESVGREPPAAR